MDGGGVRTSRSRVAFVEAGIRENKGKDGCGGAISEPEATSGKQRAVLFPTDNLGFYRAGRSNVAARDTDRRPCFLLVKPRRLRLIIPPFLWGTQNLYPLIWARGRTRISGGGV